MEINNKVFLKSNPQKIGILQKKTVKRDRIFWYVKFDKQITQYPESYLALCENDEIFDDLPSLVAKNIFNSVEDVVLVYGKYTISVPTFRNSFSQ